MILLTLRDLAYRASRFVVVIAATGVVLTLLFLMTGLIEQFNREPFLTVEAVGEDRWVVPAGVSGPFTASSTLNTQQVNELEDLGAQPIVIARGTLTIDDVASETIVFGGSADIPLQEGNLPSESGEAVIDETVGVGVGDTVRLADMDLQISGISGDTTLLAGQPLIFLSIDDARMAMFGGADVTSAALVGVGVDVAVDGVDVLTSENVAEDALGPLESAVSSIDLIRVLLWAVTAIIIGAVVYLSALERHRDFAVLRAVGATSRQLGLSLALQAVLIGGAAALLAALLQGLLTPVFPLKVRVPTSALWQIPVAAVLVSLVAAAAGMRRVRRVDPAQAFGGPGA